MPKISVIIPVYNVAPYIEKCLDSVIHQTLQDIEIICVDDCGQDNSKDIIQDYITKDNRIRLIQHEHNKGLAISRNTGLDHISGDYIFFLDSDDSISLTILEELYTTILQDNVDIVLSQTRTFAEVEGDSELDQRVQGITNWIHFEPFSQYQVTLNNYAHAFSTISCIACGRLFSRNFLQQNKLRFINDHVIHEDNGFHLKVLSCFPRVSAIDSTGILYLIRKTSIMGSVRKDEHKRKHDCDKLIRDCISYIRRTHTKKIARKLIDDILYSPTYHHWLIPRFKSIFCIGRTPTHTRIFLFGIRILKLKRSSHKHCI